MTLEQKQEAFDRVWQWAVVEKHGPSITNRDDSVATFVDSVNCAYRDGHGNRCFFGIFIPDEAYDQRMETISAESLLKPLTSDSWRIDVSATLRETLKLNYDVRDLGAAARFFNDLQQLHDSLTVQLLRDLAREPIRDYETLTQRFVEAVPYKLHVFALNHGLTSPDPPLETP